MDKIIDYILQTAGVDWDDVKQTPDTERFDRSVPWQSLLHFNRPALQTKLRGASSSIADIRNHALEPFDSTGHRYLDDLRDAAILDAFFCADDLFHHHRDHDLRIPVRHREIETERFLELVDRRSDSHVLRFGKCVFDFWDGQYFGTSDRFNALYTDPDFLPMVWPWGRYGMVANVPNKPRGVQIKEKIPKASPVKVEIGGGPMGRSIYTCCEGYYFEMFAKQLAESMAKASFFKGLYIHVTNPAGLFKETCDDLLALSKASHWKLTISTETVGQSIDLGYHVCRRYTLFNKIQRQTGDDYLLSDVDMKFDDSVANIVPESFEKNRPYVRFVNGVFNPPFDRYLPWQYCAGGIMWLPASDITTRLVEEISYYIQSTWSADRGNWFLDQLAVLYAYWRIAVAGKQCCIVPFDHRRMPSRWMRNVVDKNTVGMQHPVISRLMSEEKMSFRGAMAWAQNNQ